MSTHGRRIRKAGLAAGLAVAISLPFTLATEPTKTERDFVEMQTSINALMVAVVDWAAHEVWEAAYADTLNDRNWLTVKQYATELLVSGTLVSLGGTGRSDMGWVNTPEWQAWSVKMIDDTKVVLAAIEAQDQEALVEAGETLLVSCEGCHAVFKPTLPTEGIMHVPHHEYGDPLARE